MTRGRKKEFKSVANEQANRVRKKVNERSRSSAHDACTWCDRVWHLPHSSARGTVCFCCSLVRNQLGKQTKRKNALNQQRIGFRLRLRIVLNSLRFWNAIKLSEMLRSAESQRKTRFKWFCTIWDGKGTASLPRCRCLPARWVNNALPSRVWVPFFSHRMTDRQTTLV